MAAAVGGGGEATVEVSLARWKYQNAPPPSSSSSVRIANSGVRDALLAAVAVVPGEDEDDGQADQKCEQCDLPDLPRPVEGSLTYSSPCRNPHAPAT